MLKKLFCWELALVIAPGLYFGGAALWASAWVVEPRTRIFAGAAICFALAFTWAITALWTHDSLQNARLTYRSSDRYTVYPRVTRRRRNKRFRRMAAGVTVLLFLLTNMELRHSYQSFTRRSHAATVEVFLSDIHRTQALRVPYLASGNNRDMAFALLGVPTRNVVLGPRDAYARIMIVLRNTSGVPIHNARIRIASDVAITPGAGTMATFSDSEVGQENTDLPVFHDSSEERVLPVDIPLTSFQRMAGLLVTVEGDDIEPYAAALKVVTIRRSEQFSRLSSASLQ